MKKLSSLIKVFGNKNFSFCTTVPELGTKFTKEEWEKKEQEWQLLSKQREKSQLEHLKTSLSEYQIKRVELLAEACGELDMFEFQCFFSELNQHVYKSFGVGVVDINPEWPVLKSTEFPSWPPQNQEDLEKAIKALSQGDSLADMKQLFGGAGGGFSSGGNAATKQTVVQEDSKKVDAQPIEKSSYDIELTAFDATKKINIIKEVRQIFNLGLKDAKDLVEKAPCTLSKAVKKEDADNIKAKLIAIGCSINLL